MTDPGSDDEDDKAQGRAMVNNILRVAGAAFMLAAPLVGFNVGGISSAIGLDELTGRVFGGVLFIAGLVDFFVMPGMLAKVARNKGGRFDGPDSPS